MDIPLSEARKRAKILEGSIAIFRERRLFSGPSFSLYRRIALTLRWALSGYYMAEPPGWRVALRRPRALRTRALPEFASIGAIRSGTSCLSGYILQHPCVALPLSKEVAGIRRWKLMAQMPHKKDVEKIRGQYGFATSGYFSPIVPQTSWVQAAHKVNPRGKIVLILRNPVDRAISHFRWEHFKRRHLRLGDDSLLIAPPLNEWIATDQQSIDLGGVGIFTLSGMGLLQTGIYAPFLSALLDHFSRTQLHIVDFQEFTKDPLVTTNKVYQFLGLPQFTPELMKEKNPSPKLGLALEKEINPAVVKQLEDFYKPHNARLFDLLGVDFGWPP